MAIPISYSRNGDCHARRLARNDRVHAFSSKKTIMNISENDYKKIEELISSDESVVGIDAKKTHILILHMLQNIQDRLGNLENRLEEIEENIQD